MKKLIGIVVAATFAALIANPGFAKPEPESEQSPQTAEHLVPLTKQQLASKVPQFYSFDYDADPQPGKRYWLRVDDSTWIERYPDGFQSTFKVLGHATVNDTEGTIVVKVAGD